MNTTPSAPRLLVVEDDAELRDDILTPILTRAGFAMTAAGSALQAYQHLAVAPFDLVLLDVGLPDMDGFSILQHLSQRPKLLPVVILTGQQGSGDQIRGLDLGAHAYLTKPFDPAVLIATLRNVLRHAAEPVVLPAAESATSTQGSNGNWRLSGEAWELISPDGLRIDLNPSERSLMRLLWSRADQLVTREELIGQLTDNVYDFDSHRLEVIIHRLRKKAQDNGGESLPLWTVRGTGYILKLLPA